jgi:hypothetical protein
VSALAQLLPVRLAFALYGERRASVVYSLIMGTNTSDIAPQV